MEPLEQLDLLASEAIDAAGKFATPDWYEAAYNIIKELCRTKGELTGDDVWLKLEDTGLTTPEPRALGSVIRQAAKDGLIISTGQYRKSIRPESHRRPLLVWRAT